MRLKLVVDIPDTSAVTVSMNYKNLNYEIETYRYHDATDTLDSIYEL